MKKKLKPIAIETCGQAAKIVENIKKHWPKNEPPTYLLMPKKLFKKLEKRAKRVNGFDFIPSDLTKKK